MMRSKGSNKRVGKSWKNDVGIFLLLTITGLFMIFPIYLAVVNSIKPVQEVFLMPPKLYAMDPTFDNFKDLFKIANNSWVPFSRNIFNSIYVTVVATIFHVLFASTAAFVLSKCKFPGNALLNQIVVIALLFNSTVLYIMQYIVMATLGMINTYSALILPIIATSMGLYLMRQSMTSIPLLRHRMHKRQEEKEKRSEEEEMETKKDEDLNLYQTYLLYFDILKSPYVIPC